MLRSLILSCLLVGALPAQEPETPEPATISGTVTNAVTGEPLAGLVVASHRPGWSIQTTTDADGRYELEDMQPGGHRLVVSVPNSSEFWTRRRLAISPEDNLQSIDFKAYPNASVSGRVTDQNGEPLAGLEVVFLRPQYDLGVLSYTRASVARTDDDGRYRLVRRDFLASAEVLLWVRDFRREMSALSDDPADPEMRRQAQQATYYPNAIRPEDAELIRLALGEQRTDVDIEMQRRPSFCVEAHSDLPGDTSFALQTTQPSFGFSVTGGTAGRPSGGKVSADGNLRLCGLTRGEYRLTVYAGEPDFPSSLSAVLFSVIDEDVKNLQVITQPHVPLPGRIAWAGEAPPEPIEARVRVTLRSQHHSAGGFVSAMASLPGEFAMQTRTSLAGDVGDPLMDDYRVNVQRLPANAYVHDVTYGGESVRYKALHLGSKLPGAELVVTLGHDGGSIRTRVVNRDGEPAPDAHVIIIPKEAATHIRLAETRITDVSNQDGEHNSPALAPGEYFVLAAETQFRDLSPATVAALFEARSQAEEVTVGPNAVVDVELEVLPLER